MQKLVQGIHQFQAGVFAEKQALFEALSQGQKPEALLITCSDSRIDPGLLTQTEPGDVFVLRNAGNIVPAYNVVHGAEEATIEYAIEALGIRHLIVCGHSQCGAMKGLLHPEALTDLPAVQRWLRHSESTARVMKQKYSHLEGPELLAATVEENVLNQLENLCTHPSVAAGLERGDVYLHGWVYQFETGQVFAYNPTKGQFEALNDACVIQSADQIKIGIAAAL